MNQVAIQDDKEAIIKRMVAKDLTDDEFAIFLHNFHRTGLDPLAKQIYAVKRHSKFGESVMTIQTGIDGFRLIAERTGKYSPGKDTEFFYDDKGNLTAAKAYVKKMTPDGTWHDISAVAVLAEYKGGNLWKTMPHVMLEKCAEARALRRAFPADLSGLYSKEEMEQADVEIVESEPPKEPLITSAKLQDILKVVGPYEDLLKEILRVCNISTLDEMKQSQVEVAAKYAQQWIKRNAANDSKKERLAD